MKNLPFELVYNICLELPRFFQPWDRISYNVWNLPRFRSERICFSKDFHKIIGDLDWETYPIYQTMLWIMRDWTCFYDLSTDIEKIYAMTYERNRPDVRMMMNKECPYREFYDIILKYEGEESMLRFINERIEVISEDFELSCEKKEEDVAFHLLSKYTYKVCDGWSGWSRSEIEKSIESLDSDKVFALWNQIDWEKIKAHQKICRFDEKNCKHQYNFS